MPSEKPELHQFGGLSVLFREVIERSKEAVSAGADSVMIVTPFYEIPNQEGLYKHYATIAEAVDVPICLYNIPPHTQVWI